MSGLPEITMAGTLTADPELDHPDKGIAYVRFTVECNDWRLDPDTHEWVDLDTAFLRCTAWGQLAEHIATSLTKGTRVMVTGILRQNTFQDREGQTRTTIDVKATEVGASLKWAVAHVAKATTAGRVA